MSDAEEEEISGDCIKVFVRVRPSFTDQNACLSVTSSREIVLTAQSNLKVFEFDHVADPSTTQDTVFARVGRQIVESCVEGYNGTIFAYGQTGSGKTYTMLGPGEDNLGNFDHHLRGLIPRSLEYLFNLIQRKQEVHGKQFEFMCKASFLEIYNEQIFDLLDQCGTRPLQVRESKNRGVFVEGIVERSVASGYEAYNVLAEGWCNRKVASTSMNRESSRSHALFTLTVEIKEHTANITKVRQSVLNLVDLAGSERQKDTQTSGTHLREAGKINCSLSVLGQVIMALDDIAHNKTRHVPYRNSKLTFLLRDSLGGNAKTFIIVNVHPNTQYFGETTSTLLFAQRAKQIRNRARVNENTQGDTIQLQIEVKRLKEIISRYERTNHTRQLNNISRSVENDSFQADYELREKFFRAMRTLQKHDKTVSALRNQIEKMKKFNMSRNFVLKLRNATIATLKSGKPQSKDDVVQSLEKELEVVKEQVTHHPDIAAYQAKVTELQNEIDDLKETTIRVKALQAQEKELDELYVKLVAESEPEKSLMRTDSVFVNDSTVVSPGETEKARMAEMEENLKSKNEEIAELKEKNSGLEAELKSLKNQVHDLEKILQVTHEDSTIQRRWLNRMHESTIRTITTPKRSRSSANGLYCPSPPKIAKGPIPFEMDLMCQDSLDQDELANVPMLMDQKMPEVMEDVLQEALQEELQQVKEEMEKHREESLRKDRDLASLRHSETSMKEKLALSTQNLSETREQILKLEKELADLQANKEIASLEIRDLKILLNSADREHVETKKKLKESQNTSSQRVGQLEAECFKLQNRCFKLEEEREKVLKETQAMSVEFENQKIELVFTNEQLEKEAKALDAEKVKNKDLMGELEDVRASLEREMENSTTLQEQLDGESKAVSVEISSLRATNFELEKKVSEMRNEAKSQKDNIELKNNELDHLRKRQLKDQSVIQALRNQVTELRGSYSMLEIANAGLHAEMDELMAEFKKSVADLDKEKDQTDVLEKTLERERSKFKTKVEKHEFEMESLQEDLVCWNEQYAALEAKLADKVVELENAHNKVDTLQNELKNTAEKLKEQQTLIQKAEEAERCMQGQKNLFKDLEKNFNDVVEKYMESRSRLSELEAKVKETEKNNSDLEKKHKQDIKEMHCKLSREFEEINSSTLKEMGRKVDVALSREKEASEHARWLCQQLDEISRELESAKNELETRKKNESMRTEEVERLKTLEDKHFRQLQNVKAELAEAHQVQNHAQEELNKVSQEKEELMSEMANLAGHRNHLQKIQYLRKLKEKCQNLETDNSKLSLELRRTVGALKKYEPDFKSKRLSLNVTDARNGAPLVPKDANKN